MALARDTRGLALALLLAVLLISAVNPTAGTADTGPTPDRESVATDSRTTNSTTWVPTRTTTETAIPVTATESGETTQTPTTRSQTQTATPTETTRTPTGTTTPVTSTPTTRTSEETATPVTATPTQVSTTAGEVPTTRRGSSAEGSDGRAQPQSETEQSSSPADPDAGTENPTSSTPDAATENATSPTSDATTDRGTDEPAANGTAGESGTTTVSDDPAEERNEASQPGFTPLAALVALALAVALARRRGGTRP